jgi:hypothetical protein
LPCHRALAFVHRYKDKILPIDARQIQEGNRCALALAPFPCALTCCETRSRACVLWEQPP